MFLWKLARSHLVLVLDKERHLIFKKYTGLLDTVLKNQIRFESSYLPGQKCPQWDGCVNLRIKLVLTKQNQNFSSEIIKYFNKSG